MISTRIRCAVCHRQVDRVEWWHDIFRDTFHIKVRCHGQEDAMEIKAEFYEDLMAAGREQLETQEGVAFEQKRIDP